MTQPVLIKEVIMGDEILRALGLGTQVDRKNAGLCPICEKKIDPATFKDELSRKEFRISGLCQECQDEIFNKE